jgi:hypothetical protein
VGDIVLVSPWDFLTREAMFVGDTEKTKQHG